MTSLRELRARLDRLAVHVPSAHAGRPMTSETAIRACAAVVERMKAEGCTFREHCEPQEEAALVARALKEAAEELGQVARP